jgi:hypothetical protein
LNKHKLLDNVLDIPVKTYTQAMRMAIKYSMDDVQVAIVKVIRSISPGPGIGKAIGRLAFIAEFPGNFSSSVAGKIFTKACSMDFHPTADDLKPLMAHPALVALMMQYQEGLSNPGKAIWKESKSESNPQSGWLPEQRWVNKQLGSLGLTP